MRIISFILNKSDFNPICTNMSRFNLLNIFYLLCISFFTFACQEKQEEKQETIVYPDRPNIVWIVCEDMSPEHLETYGGTGGKTPFLNELAAESLQYDNAYSTAGVCAPSRAALITGAYQTSIGAMHMRTTGMSAAAKDVYPPGYKNYSIVLPEEMYPYPIYLRQAGYYVSNNSKEDYQFKTPVMMWDESGRNAHWRNRKDPNQPFFSIFNFTISHESQVWSRENEELLVDPKDVTVPPVYPDDSLTRRTLARFITNVMRMDMQVGEVIAQLKEDGLYDNTIIFFYSDHGDGMPYYKREMYDRGLKVPLYVKAPFLEAGTTTDELVSFVDFGPTLLSLAGVQIPETMQGQAFLGAQKAAPRKYVYGARDRMDSEYDRVRAVSDGRFKYIKNFMPEKPNYQNIRYRLQNPLMLHLLDLHEKGQLTPEQDRWFDATKPEEELYDTQSDPYEFVNLVGNSDYQDKLVEMRMALEDWMIKYGDKGALNEVEMVNDWWGGQETAPATATPEVSFQDGKISLKSATPSTLFGYRKSKNDSWEVYSQPFEWNAGDSLYVNAQRIGYEASEISLIVQ
ncbi:arylsulfatase A-like enzyme [Algoriphagus zhangzhouensis]|uniref:Arylsulfatase A n=2 Tax=Algoriphagus zhangzhouensis TaxID=1073327 RepID=A0A1M7Z9R4_9BACT|nr:arylsulfatase A-like enzyme [Algoriphagus zhangzhouensis]SHO61539.1 Arylsulfatase A [Algoriphagus zhangzhouensis]